MLETRRIAMRLVRAFLKRFLGKCAEPKPHARSIIPDFAPHSETEALVKSFAALHSVLIGEKLYGVEGGIKIDDLASAVRGHEDAHGERMRDYLKAYIEVWSVVQTPGPNEWHRWYAAGMLRQKKAAPEQQRPSSS